MHHNRENNVNQIENWQFRKPAWSKWQADEGKPPAGWANGKLATGLRHASI